MIGKVWRIDVDTKENADKMRDWLKTGRGIRISQSQDLSTCGRFSYQPGDTEGESHWSMKTVTIVLNPAHVNIVCQEELEFKSMPLVTRRYVDLSIFVEIFDHIRPNGFSLKSTKLEDLVYYSPEFESADITICFSRYTMSPHGYHVGYEEYEAKLHIIEARGIENSPTSVHHLKRFLIDLDSLHSIECVSAPDSEECACASGKCDCDPDDHYCTEDECMCEPYMSPMDDDSGTMEDFTYGEFENMIESIIQYPARWEYTPENTWCIVDNEGDTIYESEWKPDNV